MGLLDIFKETEEKPNSQGLENTISFLQERLADLELALEDKDWMRLNQAESREFSREGLEKINKLARMYWLKNPLIKRAVAVQTSYVFSKSIEISSSDDDVQEFIDQFWDDEKNKAELTTHQSLIQKENEMQIFSNIFFVFFTNFSTGHTTVRTISEDEIKDIVCNPEDSKEVWYYKRQWTQRKLNTSTGNYETETRTAYYPDFRYDPEPKNKPDKIGQHKVMWDNPVYHVKVNCLSDMKFGVSEIYAAFDWAKAYKGFLEDWATIVKALSRFAWKKKVKGSKSKVNQIAKNSNTGIGRNGFSKENNPPATTGSTYVSNEGVSLEPVKTQGATTKAEDGRRLLLMVSAATGIYEHYFGDPSTGNLATSKSMERPMELMFKERQNLWHDVFENIIKFILTQSYEAANGIITDEPAELMKTVDITMPELLEKDISNKVDAIIKAGTLDGKRPVLNTEDIMKMLLRELEVDNIDEIIKNIPEAKSILPDMGDNTDPEEVEERLDMEFVSAVNELRESVIEILKEDG